MNEQDKIDALKMKEDIQRKVQGELAGSSSAQLITKIRQIAEQGTLGDWWAKASQHPRRCA